MATFSRDGLQVYVTLAELARHANCDPRSLPRELLKPVAQILVGTRLRDLFHYPSLNFAATKVVNSTIQPAPINNAQL
jgi:hypothetical protein